MTLHKLTLLFYCTRPNNIRYYFLLKYNMTFRILNIAFHFFYGTFHFVITDHPRPAVSFKNQKYRAKLSHSTEGWNQADISYPALPTWVLPASQVLAPNCLCRKVGAERTISCKKINWRKYSHPPSLSPLRHHPLISVVCSCRCSILTGWSFGGSIVVRRLVARGGLLVAGGLPVAGVRLVGGFLVRGTGVSVWTVFSAVANFLPHFLRDLLHDDSRDGVTNLLRDLDTNLLGNFLLHIHWILSADRLGKFFAFFSWNIDRKVLASLIRDFFALCSGNLLLDFLRNWRETF